MNKHYLYFGEATALSSRHCNAKFYKSNLYSSISEPSKLDLPNWERITNEQSKTVKLFKSVHKANKSKRLQIGLTVAEGVRLVCDILSNEQSRKFVRRIVVSEELLSVTSTIDGEENRKKLQHWLQVVHTESMQRKLEYDQNNIKEVEPKLCSINIGTEQVVAACSGTVNTQGVVALMEIPDSYDPLATKPIAPFYLILDGLADPGNVGTLLRSCAAANVDALILLPDSCDVFNPKAVRSAMGASFRVPVLDLGDSRVNKGDIGGIKLESFDGLLDLLQHCGINSSRVFAATMEESGDKRKGSWRQSVPYYQIDWSCTTDEKGRGAALVLGKEGEGLREEVCHAIRQGNISTVHVPMAQGTESLNAAVCGSVIMFERMRQSLSSGKCQE